MSAGIYTDFNRREPYQVLQEAHEREDGPYSGPLVRITAELASEQPEPEAAHQRPAVRSVQAPAGLVLDPVGGNGS